MRFLLWTVLLWSYLLYVNYFGFWLRENQVCDVNTLSFNQANSQELAMVGGCFEGVKPN